MLNTKKAKVKSVWYLLINLDTSALFDPVHISKPISLFVIVDIVKT